MNTVVCVKQVVDPEEPPASFKVDEAGKQIVLPAGVPSVISPFDRQAVEAALRIKDAHGGKVTALSLGANFDKNVVRDPLAMGADELILVEHEAFVDGDSWSTAYGLAMAIKKIGEVDLIFCGRQASDSDSGQVGSIIASMLGMPCIAICQKVEVSDGGLRVERVSDDGYEVLEVSRPALLTVSNELGEPRYPTVKQVMAAKRQTPVVWTPSDLGVDAGSIGAAGRRTRLVKLFQPGPRRTCEFVDGETPEHAGAKLAERLREAGLV